MLFQQSKNQNGPYLWKSCACILYYLALIPTCIYATINGIWYMEYILPVYLFRKFKVKVKGRSSSFLPDSCN